MYTLRTIIHLLTENGREMRGEEEFPEVKVDFQVVCFSCFTGDTLGFSVVLYISSRLYTFCLSLINYLNAII